MIETPTHTPAMVAFDLADALNERGRMAMCLIVRAVHAIGIDVAYDLAARALFLEATGGLPLGEPWNRKRTPGGVFFYLLKGELDHEQHMRVFGRDRKAAATQDVPQPVPAPARAVMPTKAATVSSKPPERPCAACGEQADVVAKFNISRAGKQCICVRCADRGFVFGPSGAVVRLQEQAA